MPQVTVYIRKADLPQWEAVKKKSEFIHNALMESSSKVEQVPVKNKVASSTLASPATEPEDEDEYDYLAGLVFQEGIAVWDTATGEKVPATPEMIKELKKRGQVK